MKLGSIIRVIWIDSCSSSGWCKGNNFGDTTMCESVGWLVQDDRKSITVAGHRSESTDEWNGAITIPRVAIKSLKRITT